MQIDLYQRGSGWDVEVWTADGRLVFAQWFASRAAAERAAAAHAPTPSPSPFASDCARTLRPVFGPNSVFTIKRQA